MKPKEFFDHYQFWRRESLTPIVNIEGYASLLLDGHFGEFTKEQKEWLQLILQNSTEARQRWDDFGEHLRIYYKLPRNNDEPILFAEAIKSLFFRLEHYKYFGQTKIIEVEIPDPLQAAKINYEFVTVFFHLLAPSLKLARPGLIPEDMPEFMPKIVASQSNGLSVHIEVYSMARYFHRFDEQNGGPSYSSMDINLADQILKQRGIPLKVEILDGINEEFTRLIFLFEIPAED